jgi:hypothetical protein
MNDIGVTRTVEISLEKLTESINFFTRNKSLPTLAEGRTQKNRKKTQAI